MSSTHQSTTESLEPMHYQIRLKGHLDAQWTDWFAGLTVSLEENGDTLLTGPVADQAALHGLFKKIRDLGLPLISVLSIEPDSTDLEAVRKPQRVRRTRR